VPKWFSGDEVAPRRGAEADDKCIEHFPDSRLGFYESLTSLRNRSIEPLVRADAGEDFSAP